MMAQTMSGKSVPGCFGQTRLELLKSRQGYLLGKLPKFLGLLGQRVQLPLGIGGRQFDEFRRRHPEITSDKTPWPLVCWFEQIVVILDPFKAHRIAMLDTIGRFSGGRTHPFNSVLRRDVLI